MNLSDRKKFEASKPFFTGVAVQTTDTLLIKGAAARTSLIISSPVTNIVWIVANQAAASGIGIRLAPNNPPLILTFENVGNAILGEWRAIALVAAETIGVFSNEMIH